MREERYWLAVVSDEAYDKERLYSNDTVSCPSRGMPGETGPARDALVVLVAASDPSVLFGLGRVDGWFTYGDGPTGGVIVRYTHRLVDEPIPVDGTAVEPGLSALAAEDYERLAGRVGADRRADADKAEWFVSVALPIEASSQAEAVREFWTYVDKLGPRELPAFVWPRGDELAMQAYLLGAETNLDPEDDD